MTLACHRVLLLCGGGMAVMFTSKVLDFGGAGPFGCLVLGFVAAVRWKLDSETFLVVESCISSIWQALEPFLFSLIGGEVTLSSLRKDIGSSILVLGIAIMFRLVTALLATVGGGFSWKEKVFVAFAWLPKATVQAAVGPQALDYVLVNNKGAEMEDYAQKVLAVAVLSILMTAPVGAILISLLGPLLLTHDGNETEMDKLPESLPLEDISHL